MPGLDRGQQRPGGGHRAPRRTRRARPAPARTSTGPRSQGCGCSRCALSHSASVTDVSRIRPGARPRHEAEPVGADDRRGVVPVELHHLVDRHPVAVAVADQAARVEPVAEARQRQLGQVGVPGLLLVAERAPAAQGAGERLRVGPTYGAGAGVEGVADRAGDVRGRRDRGLARVVLAGAGRRARRPSGRAPAGPRGSWATACARHRGQNDRRTARSCPPRCPGRSPAG